MPKSDLFNNKLLSHPLKTPSKQTKKYPYLFLPTPQTHNCKPLASQNTTRSSYLHHKHMTVNLLLHKVSLEVLTCVCGVGKNF
jgi:hypothetical protein